MSDLFGLGSLTGAAGGALSLGGGLLSGIFGKKEAKPVRYSGDLSREIDRFSRGLSADDPTYASSLADYASANKNRIANTQRLAGLAESDFSGMLGSAKNYDTLSTHNALLGSQVAALKDIMGYAGDQGRREDSLALAALGLGGRSGGSYERALVADRMGRAFAPQFGNIISNLGGVYSTAANDRMSNLSAIMDMINARTGTADYGAGLELNPALATLQIRGGQIGNLGGLAEAAKANTAGFTEKKNWASSIGDSMQTAGNGMMGMSGAGGGLGGLNLGGSMGGMNFGVNYGGGYGGYGGGYGSLPSNLYQLTPAERAQIAGYSVTARQNVPFNSTWE